MVMEAAPSAPFEMPEVDLLFEFLIVALDAPAQLDVVDQRAEGDVSRKRFELRMGARSWTCASTVKPL